VVCICSEIGFTCPSEGTTGHLSLWFVTDIFPRETTCHLFQRTITYIKKSIKIWWETQEAVAQKALIQISCPWSFAKVVKR